MLNNIAIIPARSGSKGLPDKNIRELNGKPLLAYSIEAAVKSKMFAQIMVSTDSTKYAEIARQFGADVPFLRSRENSSDAASSWDVVREVLESYKKLDKQFDTVCLLQPTSPLRNATDIRSAYDVFVTKKASAVIGVCETDHSPMWCNTLPNNLSMNKFISASANMPRQKLDKYYRINGAIYIVNVKKLENRIDIYSNSYAFIMPRERSVDIDTEFDFVIAEAVLRYFRFSNHYIG